MSTHPTDPGRPPLNDPARLARRHDPQPPDVLGMRRCPQPCRTSQWLRRSVQGWHALAALVLFLVFGATVLPVQASRVQGDSPDTAFLYSADDLTRMAEAYGEEGRDGYVRSRWTFDVAFPMVYGFFLVTSIAWLLGRALPADSPWQLANLVPLAAVAFDLLENTMATVMMRAYPAPAPLAATLAPVMSALKWLFVGGSFAVLAAAASLALWRRMRSDRRA